MTTITPFASLTNPLGGQQIELQQLDYAGGGISLLRIRIRERTRFTVFEIDAQTARQWGEALLQWARLQAQTDADPAEESAPGALAQRDAP